MESFGIFDGYIQGFVIRLMKWILLGNKNSLGVTLCLHAFVMKVDSQNLYFSREASPTERFIILDFIEIFFVT